jgi:hypothetical protein
MKQKQQVVHIHGGTPFASYDLYLQALKEWEIKLDDSFREKRWSRNYDAFLNPDRYQCIRPIMPSKSNPKYLEWVIWFEKLLPHLRDKVIFVGHSLGGIFLAKYLSEHILPITISQLQHYLKLPYISSKIGVTFLVRPFLNCLRILRREVRSVNSCMLKVF